MTDILDGTILPCELLHKRCKPLRIPDPCPLRVSRPHCNSQKHPHTRSQVPKKRDWPHFKIQYVKCVICYWHLPVNHNQFRETLQNRRKQNLEYLTADFDVFYEGQTASSKKGSSVSGERVAG